MKRRKSRLIINPKTRKRSKVFCQSLGARQMELVEYMALGYSNDGIARQMGIKTKSVKNVIRIVFRKLNPSEDEDPRGAAIMLCHVYHQCKNTDK